MSSHINEEVMLLLVSLYGGIVLIVTYDIIKILRRVFKASNLRVLIEDIIFWTVAAVYIFNIFLKYNYGTPRYFAIMAVLGAMCLFEALIGRRLTDKISSITGKILETLSKPLKKVLNVFKLKLTRHKKRMSEWKKEKVRRQGKEPQSELAKSEKEEYKIEE